MDDITTLILAIIGLFSAWRIYLFLKSSKIIKKGNVTQKGNIVEGDQAGRDINKK